MWVVSGVYSKDLENCLLTSTFPPSIASVVTRGYMSPDHRRFWHRRDVEKQLGPLAEAPEKEAKDESTRDFPRVGF